MADLGRCRSQLFTRIPAIGKDRAQPGEAVTDAGEHVGRTVAVLDIGGVDDRPDQEALGVGEDMTLPALDLLARIITPWPAALRGFDALAVDHPGRRRGLPSDGFAHRHEQGVIDRRPQPHVPPAVEIMLHCGHRRKQIGRQHPPRQTAAQQIEQGSNDLPIAPYRRSPPARAKRKQRLQHRPFGIRQIAWQPQPPSGKLLAGDVGPPVILRRCLAPSIESQMADITQLLFRSGS